MQRADESIEYAGQTISEATYLGQMYVQGSSQMQGGIPPGPGVAVVVGQTMAESNKTLNCKLTVRAIPRWKELRGAD
jgi:hypothetical protein